MRAGQQHSLVQRQRLRPGSTWQPGLALDDAVQVDGVRFLRHLQDLLNTL